MAIEDARFIIEPPPGIDLDPRTPSPDFAAHLRLQREWGRFQIAGLYRLVGVQHRDSEVFTGNAWGLNFTGVLRLPQSTKAYYQLVFGEGIGSYRSLPDAAPATSDRLEALPLFGWMVGVTHDWNDDLSSNFTYAENYLENTAGQAPDEVRRTTYLAANLIWKPAERVSIGIEYLYGLRENVDGAIGTANRLQTSFIFDLP